MFRILMGVAAMAVIGFGILAAKSRADHKKAMEAGPLTEKEQALLADRIVDILPKTVNYSHGNRGISNVALCDMVAEVTDKAGREDIRLDMHRVFIYECGEQDAYWAECPAIRLRISAGIEQELAGVCRTPEAMFHIFIGPHNVGVQFVMPPDQELELDEAGAKVLEDELHNAIEAVMAQFFPTVGD